MSLNLDQRFALSDQDRPHILSMGGSVEVPHTRGLQCERRVAVPERHAVHAHRQHHRPEPQRVFRGAVAGRHLQRRRDEPERDHGGERRRHQRRARARILPPEHARRLSVQAARQPDAAGARRHLQRHEPCELQQSDGHDGRRDQLGSARCRDVPGPAFDSRRRADADGAVQCEVLRSEHRAGRAGRAGPERQAVVSPGRRDLP